MSSLRKNVLASFKNLHKTRKIIFAGDEKTLEAARQKINEEFKKNKNVDKKEDIEQMIKLANDVDHELKSNVIQAVEQEPGVYEAKITPSTTKLDNVIFNEDAIIETPRKRKCKPPVDVNP